MISTRQHTTLSSLLFDWYLVDYSVRLAVSLDVFNEQIDQREIT